MKKKEDETGVAPAPTSKKEKKGRGEGEIKMAKTLHIVETDYPSDIGLPRGPFTPKGLIRRGFLEKLQRVLPPEAQHFPVVSVGLYEDDEEWSYFIGFGCANILSLPFEDDEGEIVAENRGKAQVLDDLLMGIHKEIRAMWIKEIPPVCYLINTAGKHYAPVFEILKRDFDYTLQRVNVRMNKEERKLVAELYPA